MMDAAEHIEWVYLEACVRSRKADRAAGKVTRGQWFQLATMLEELFPVDLAEYRKRIGVEP